MPTIEEMITELQHEVTRLRDRDSDHDHNITILLGQLLKIVPELNDMRTEMNTRFDKVDTQLAAIIRKLDERK